MGFFAELRRRRVLQMGGAYVAGAWLGAEILNFLLEQFNAPDWTYRFLAIVFVAGFPLTMILAWIVQVQEDGSWAIDPSRGDYRTVGVAVALGVLATAGLSWLIVPEREPEPVYEPLPNSLAVLPFADDDELYRVLMAGLEQCRDLNLVRLDHTKAPDDLLAFARSLRVTALAHGRPAGSAVGDLLELELFDTIGGEIIWAASFKQDSRQIVETGLAMANSLLEALAKHTLSREEFTGTEIDAAFETFLAGIAHANTTDSGSLRIAMDSFEQAIELDPVFVRAHVGLAETIYDMLAYGEPGEDERASLEKRAAEAVALAQKLDPKSADATYLLGLFDSNRQLRIQAFERAIELDPDHYRSYFRYAILMKEEGRREDAEQMMRQALLYLPMSERFRNELADLTRLQSSG